VRAAASRGGSMCSLLLAAPKYAVSATGFVWLCVPDISMTSWHPFEYIAVPVADDVKLAGGRTACHAGTGLLLHIKAYDGWTRQLVKLVEKSGGNFTVKV
jgi:hypothetical protein